MITTAKRYNMSQTGTWIVVSNILMAIHFKSICLDYVIIIVLLSIAWQLFPGHTLYLKV